MSGNFFSFIFFFPQMSGNFSFSFSSFQTKNQKEGEERGKEGKMEENRNDRSLVELTLTPN